TLEYVSFFCWIIWNCWKFSFCCFYNSTFFSIFKYSTVGIECNFINFFFLLPYSFVSFITSNERHITIPANKLISFSCWCFWFFWPIPFFYCLGDCILTV